jgi:capsid protein
MSSISEKIRARGFDPETVFAELQRDVARLREGGLLEGLLALQGKALPGSQPAAGSARNATS